MITSFKIFENLKNIELENVEIKVENTIPPLLDFLIENFAFIFHKQKRKYRALKIKSIKGVFNKRTLKKKNEYFETNLLINLASKPNDIEDVLDITALYDNTQCAYTIKINNDIVYDISNDEKEDYNKKLIELALREYKKYLKSKNWKIKNA